VKRPAAGRGLALLIDHRRVEAAIWRNHLAAAAPKSRMALFDYYRPLARRLARSEFHRIGGHGLELGDFEQLAVEGLLQAIDRFDASRGTRFGGYATLRIRGCIRNELSKASEAGARFSHRKRAERDRLRSLRAAAEPNDDPLALIASLATKIAIGAMLEEPVQVDPDELASGEPSAYDTVAWKQLVGELDRRLVQLPANEATVLEQHYRHGVAFKQIAQLLGLSQGRVSQLHAQGLERLRRQLGRQR
jgi:RNA polymerase sigma factor for flagellar operon FliA